MLNAKQQAWIDDYETYEWESKDMGTVASVGEDREFERAPAGAHLARCYMVIDLGMQSSSYMGKPKKAHKIHIAWELPNELMQDGRPFSVSSRYTLSLFDQAILRQHLESWRGRGFTDEELKGFDVKKVLGAYCQVSIVHNTESSKTYANVKGVIQFPKGMAKPNPVNPDVYYDIENGDITKLPEWLQETVKKSDEWIAKTTGRPQEKTGTAAIAEMDDDIPF